MENQIIFLGQDLCGTLGFILDGLKSWIEKLQKDCKKEMKTVGTDKSSDFRNSQRVENTGAERLGENNEGKSTKDEKEHPEEFVQE